jgi:hypothetical protein
MKDQLITIGLEMQHDGGGLGTPVPALILAKLKCPLPAQRKSDSCLPEIIIIIVLFILYTYSKRYAFKVAYKRKLEILSEWS